MRRRQRSSLSQDMQRGLFSIVGPARRIRNSKLTRWAGRHALSATARRRIEARAHSDQSCPARTWDVESPGRRGGSESQLFQCRLCFAFPRYYEPRIAVFRGPETSRNRKENEQLTNVSQCPTVPRTPAPDKFSA